MNVLYCGDENIADGVLISSLSLAKNVSETLRIYILTSHAESRIKVFKPLPESFADFLETRLKTVKTNVTVKLFDITDVFNKYLPNANINTRFTPCCMLRLYADLVKELPEKILYLDNDIICRKSPESFYNQDMTDFEIAGSLDYYGSWFFKKNILKRDYLNSGVLLLNLKNIRKNGLFEKCRKYCAENKMFMPDQSAVNKLTEKKKICQRKFNEQRKLNKDTVFQHFTTSFRIFPWFHTVSVKPWNIEDMHNKLSLYEYDDLFYEFSNLKN